MHQSYVIYRFTAQCSVHNKWAIAAGLSLCGKASFPRVSWHWSQREYGQTYHQDVPLCSGESVEGYFTPMCAYSGKTEKGGAMQGESFTGELGLEHGYPSISRLWGISPSLPEPQRAPLQGRKYKEFIELLSAGLGPKYLNKEYSKDSSWNEPNI